MEEIPSNDKKYLYQALELAKLRRGFCAPNPSVGAVLVDGIGNVIAEGYHHEYGAPHAEIAALHQVSHEKISNGTLFVTLEPCCHWGKTPPCTEALIRAGIKRVVYGYVDPNPVMAGKGIQALQAAGIICDYMPMVDIQDFYASYDYWVTTKKPFITAKIAMTLNGKIAGPKGERIQITGSSLHEHTHYCRKNSDAILTTARTILYDNPQLNVRYGDSIFSKPIYIIDSELNIPLSSTIFSTAKSITIFYKKTMAREKIRLFKDQGVRCVEMDHTPQGVSLQQVFSQIGQDGIHDLWVEAGGTLFLALMKEKMLQRAFIYIAPWWLNEGQSAFNEDFSLNAPANASLRWKQVGKDVLCQIDWHTQPMIL